MLAELALINSAFATIKTTIAHSRDIASAANAISKFVNAEEDLRERANAKQNSIFTKLLGKDTNDFEEFMALEEVKVKREELREMMQLYGRANMYTDWIKFQTESRKKRQQLKEEQQEAFDNLIWNLSVAALVLVIVGGIGLVAYFAWFLKTS